MQELSLILMQAEARTGPAQWEHQRCSFYGEAITTKPSQVTPRDSYRDKDTQHSASTCTRITTCCLPSCLHFSGPWGWTFRRRGAVGDDLIPSWIYTPETLVVTMTYILPGPHCKLFSPSIWMVRGSRVPVFPQKE